MSDQFIVAEISKNWCNGKSADGELISQKFEKLIAVNQKRGYSLHSFGVSQVVNPDKVFDMMNETIIAVFKKDSGGKK